MSLLLCRQEQVTHPYYMETLGVHLYSSQELAYVIFHYPLLTMENFVDERLLVFLREELGQGFLALKIERYLKGGGSSDEVLAMILSESDYYTAAEIGRFRQLLSNFRGRHPADYGKAKADELFFLKQYAKAEQLYRKLLEHPRDRVVNDAFIGKIWSNLGSCYARMFRMKQALEALEKAYLRTGEKKLLEQMLILTWLDPRQKLSDRLRALVDEDMEKRSHARMEAAKEAAAGHEKLRELETLFMRDGRRRKEGEELLLHRWKEDYRRTQ